MNKLTDEINYTILALLKRIKPDSVSDEVAIYLLREAQSLMKDHGLRWQDFLSDQNSRVIKCLEMSTSTFDPEALTAFRRVKEMMTKENFTWTVSPVVSQAGSRAWQSSGMAGAHVFNCPVDSRPCQVVASFEAMLKINLMSIYGSLDVEKPFQEDIRVIEEYLPCHYCKQAEKDTALLIGMRLGKTERQILKSAGAAPPDETILIQPDTTSRASRESMLRAIRKLRKYRLLFSEQARVRYWESNGRPDRIAVRLTPLGRAMLRATGTLLDGGKRIRWPGVVAELKKAVKYDLVNLRKELGQSLIKASKLQPAETHAVYARILNSLGIF